MRKADLVEAIVTAATGSNGAERSSPRKIRSTQASGGDDLASIAEEENALAAGADSVDEMALIRPQRRATTANPSSGNGSDSDSSSNGSGTVSSPHQTRTTATGTTASETEIGTEAGAEADAATANDAPDHDVNDTETSSVDRAHQGQPQWRA